LSSRKDKRKNKKVTTEVQWSPNALENNHSNRDFMELEENLMEEINSASKKRKEFF